MSEGEKLATPYQGGKVWQLHGRGWKKLAGRYVVAWSAQSSGWPRPLWTGVRSSAGGHSPADYTHVVGHTLASIVEQSQTYVSRGAARNAAERFGVL